jgi:hypothetical protein
VFKKKPWSDGLFPDFDDSFESRFYCFGGDGGGGSSSGGRNEPRQNRYDPADQEPERGRPAPPPTRPTPPSPRPYEPEPYEGQFTSQIAENIYRSGADAPPPPAGASPRPMGIAEMFPSAVVEPAAAPRITESPLVSYVEEPRFGISGLLDFSDMSVGFDSPNQVYEDAISLGNTGLSVGQVPPSTGRTIQGLADKFDVPSSVNIGGYEIGFPKIGPGRLEPTIDPQNRSVGLNYKIDISNPVPSIPPNYETETDAEFDARMDRMYGEQYEQDRARMINQARRDQYFENQSDVGVFTPPPTPAPSYPNQNLLTDRREVLPQQYGGFADPLKGGNISNLLTPSGNPYAGTTGAFVPTVGFENGGDVPVQEGVGGLFPPEELARMDQASQELDALRAQGGGGLFSLEELARQDKISAAKIQPDGSMPGVDTLRHATPEEVDVGAYNYQKDLEDKLLYHVKERDKVNPFEFMGITTDRKRFHQNQVEQVQKLIEDFRGQRGAAVANYRDYIAAGGRPLIVNTEEEPYFKSFPTDLINFRATKP